jgi:chaperonin GroES
MEYKPLFDRILVKPVTAEQTVGGLYIPDSSNNLKKGIVVAAGEGLAGKPMAISEGQEVLFSKEDGTPVTLEGQQYLVMKENAVWMVK